MVDTAAIPITSTDRYTDSSTPVDHRMNECSKAPTHSALASVIHSATCDNCYAQVRGIRWKCSQCEDFDFCDTCYAGYENGSVIHSSDHVFMRFRKPAPYPIAKAFIQQGEFYGGEDKRSISALEQNVNKLRFFLSRKTAANISELEAKLTSVEAEKSALEAELETYRQREQQEQQRVEAERRERERLDAEQQELIRQEIARKEEERATLERLEAARLENDRKRMLLEEEARNIAENMKAVEQAAKKDVEKEAKERKKFEKELALLADMGFTNELQNLALLNRHRDVNAVLMALLQ